MTKARELSDYTGLQGDLALKSPVASPVFTGNVGVGVIPEATHSSADVLQVGGTALIANWEDAETYVGENVYISTAGTYKYLTTSHASLYNQNSGKHVFQIAPSGTADSAISWTTAMTIDNAGRVTMPNQPYFVAEMNGNATYVSMSAGSAFPFNSTGRNVGSHFNTSNYRFTAPVNGNYSFSVGVITNSSAPNGRLQFYVNNTTEHLNTKMGISGGSTAGGGATNTSAIIYLSANDFVDVRSQSGTAIGYQQDHSFFTGILLS